MGIPHVSLVLATAHENENIVMKVTRSSSKNWFPNDTTLHFNTNLHPTDIINTFLVIWVSTTKRFYLVFLYIKGVRNRVHFLTETVKITTN